MHLRRTLLVCIAFIMITVTAGCENIVRGRTEINDLEFVRAIAIDKSLSNTGNVRLTISTQIVHGGGGQSQEKESTTVNSEGRTVFEAIGNFSKYLGKKPFFGHLEYIIIGEEAARDGIYKYLDLFCRDHEIRLNLKVYVLKGNRAEELIERGSSKNKFIFDKLRGLVESRAEQSVTNLVNLIEVMYIMDIKYLSLYLPCIEMIKATKGEAGEDKSIDVKMAGFAIFDGDKLVAHLDEDMGRGLNWLMNKIHSGIIVVKGPDGSEISLEIIDAKTKIQPDLKNGDLSVTVKIDMSSNIAEIQSPQDIFNSETFVSLKNQQEQIIESEVENVIKYAQQETGLDFFSTGDKFYQKYPIEWEDIYERNWRKVFPKIKFKVIAESKINRTYDIKQPNAVEEGER